MSSDHLQRLKELWEKLEPLDPQERQALIEEHRTTDPDVVAEVEQMLFDSGISDEFLGGSVRDEVRPVELEGKTLGEFEVVAEIGRGGSGVVYRAFQPSLTRTVALKVLLPHLTQTDEAVDRFAREARAAAKLDHRHIVPIYAVSTEGEHHFYAMRWVAGPDLSSDHRSDEPRVLPKRGDRRFVSAAVRIVAQVARALEHAHERGIVHRDVKPHNILLSLDGDALLTDFGIARDPSMQTIFRPDQIAGTVAYMSPEQARATGYEDVDHRSDVYSLGVVLYELLTGRLPFEGPSVDAVLLKVRSAEPQRVKKLADIRQDLADVCHQAMAKRPEERYPTAAEMAEDLESILRFGAPKNLIHRSPVQKAWHYVRQNRKRFLVAALVLLAVFGGYGFSAYRASLRDLALLDLRVFDREAQPLAIDGDVLIRPLNEVTGEPATKEGRVPSLIELGRISEGPFSVSPGYGRVVVRFDGDDSFAELTRRFERDESYVLRVYHRASTTVENAVEVGPGMLTRPMAPDGPKSALDGKRVTIRAVFVDQYEVSNAEFREFLRAIRELEGNMRPRHWPAEDAWDDALDSLPVSAVAWEDAQHYAEWAGKRLLTLGEWELAARGTGSGRRFPWGENPNVNCVGRLPLDWTKEEQEEWGRQFAIDEPLKRRLVYLNRVQPVQSRPEAATRRKIFHLVGNVDEFLEPFFVMDPHGERERPDVFHRYRVGGSWTCDPAKIDTSLGLEKVGIGSENVWPRMGFRCGKSVNP